MAGCSMCRRQAVCHQQLCAVAAAPLHGTCLTLSVTLSPASCSRPCSGTLNYFCLQSWPGCLRRDGTAKVGDVGMAKVCASTACTRLADLAVCSVKCAPYLIALLAAD